MVLPAHAAVTPVGNPVTVPMPVAPVVVWDMVGLKAVLTHRVLVAFVVTVLLELTTTFTFEEAVQPFPALVITAYVPAIEEMAFVKLLFCNDEE